jgi:hypothetical protein
MRCRILAQALSLHTANLLFILRTGGSLCAELDDALRFRRTLFFKPDAGKLLFSSSGAASSSFHP